jgi:hypothetical protein
MTNLSNAKAEQDREKLRHDALTYGPVVVDLLIEREDYESLISKRDTCAADEPGCNLATASFD